MENALNIEGIITNTSYIPQGVTLLVAIDFNVDLSNMERNVEDKNIAAAIANTGLEGMGTNVLLQCKP